VIDSKQNHSRLDTLPTERVGLIVWTLMDNRGQRFTTAELARLTHLQHNSVWAMLAKLSRVLPIRQSLDGWYVE
jgi:hypothetical protein